MERESSSSTGSRPTVVFRYEDFQEELLAITTATEPTQLHKAQDTQEIERHKRDERLRLKQRLENHDRMCVRRPLSYWWRQGRFPSAKEILRGKALLKAYAVGLYVLYAVPRASIRRRRIERMPAEQAEDYKSIAIGADLCAAWLGKVAGLPLLSAFEDHGLRLNPTNNELLWGLDQWRVAKNTMRLKVRVRYILRTICETLPPVGVLNMLQLLVTDGRYLHESYLYPHEQAVLEFDEFGATRRMVFPMKELELSGFPNGTQNQMQERSRCRTLLISHVFLKVLICRVVMVPWSAGICRLPSPAHLAQTVENLRHIASLTFAIVKLCDHNIPPLAPTGSGSPDFHESGSYWSWFSAMINEWLSQLLTRVDMYEELLDSNQAFQFDWEFLSKWLYPSSMYSTPHLESFISEYRAVVSDWIDRCLDEIFGVTSNTETGRDAKSSARTKGGGGTTRSVRIRPLSSQSDLGPMTPPRTKRSLVAGTGRTHR